MTIFQRLTDGQSAPLPINRIPRQPNHLRSAQSRFQQQNILPIVVGTLSNFQKLRLLVNRQEMNIIWRAKRLIHLYAFQRMLDNHVVDQCGLKHRSDCDVRLTDSRACIMCFHAVKYSLTVHRLHIT